MDKEQFMGFVKGQIGSVGHLSVPNATDPFKNALYNVISEMYDLIQAGSGGSSRTSSIPASLTESISGLEESVSAVEEKIKENEITKSKIADLEDKVAKLASAVDAFVNNQPKPVKSAKK